VKLEQGLKPTVHIESVFIPGLVSCLCFRRSRGGEIPNPERSDIAGNALFV
jgi:hypothetical protein